MNGKEMGGDGGGPDAVGGPSNAPTLDQVYAAIMSQKRKAQEIPPAPTTVAEPAVPFRSGLGASLRNSTLEQLLFQGLGAGHDDGQTGTLSIMRSNTMENILRETLSSGRELHDLMLDWNHSLPEEKFVEGLASDMLAIDAAPPDVLTMRRTFTLERILSGAETDLAGMMRANQQQLLRQQSGAGAAAAGSEGTGTGEAGQMVRPGGRTAERLQRQESVHRLAASSGPGHQPRPGGGPMGPPSARGPGGTLRPSTGSGRYGAMAAAALAAAEEVVPRSPKRHKLHHLVKSEGGPGGTAGPERTWSQSLLDLAKAAAALDGRDLDDDADVPADLEKERNGAGEQQRYQQQQLEAAGAGGEGSRGAYEKPEGRGPGMGDEKEGEGMGRLGRAGGREGAGTGGGSAPGGGGAALSSSMSAAQLLRSLSGMKAPVGQGQRVGGGGGPATASTQPNAHDTKLFLKLQGEADRLQRDNEGLNAQLEAVLSQVDIIQQKNSRMKQMLLNACHSKGIQADMDLLNVSLQHHRVQPMGEAQATHVAATVLGLNGGDVLATVQHLIGIALLRISEGQ